MDIKVIRSAFTSSTLGKMYINNTFFSYTLEDTDRHLNGKCGLKFLPKQPKQSEATCRHN